MRTTSDQAITQPTRPTLYLVYLAFLFLPWLFYAPKLADIGVTLTATLIYLPLHYASFKATGARRLLLIAAIAALGVATAPFQNGHSVFHIYAAAAAGYIRPIKISGIVLGLCIAVFVASSLFFDRYILELAVGLVISIVVWVSTFADAEAHAGHERAERERTLEAQQASLVERERIARDLHDVLGHTLTLVSLKADLASRLIEVDTDRAKAEIESIRTSTREALSDIRATLSGLTATSISDELENASTAFEAAGITLKISGQMPDLPTVQDTAAGLMIREAATNIIRHSSATEVIIVFEKDAHSVGISVSDNGASEGIREGNGLSGLRKRFEALGGAFSIAETGGVQLRAVFPA